jgi:hypothetical protein
LEDSYSGLFKKKDKQSDNGDADLDKDRKKTFHEHWGWIPIIDSISGEDPLRWEEVEKLNVIKFLNIVSYLKDKADHQRELMNSNGRS